MRPHTHMLSERVATETFVVALIALVALSMLWGYWKIMVLHDFTIYTSEEEEEVDRYVPLPEGLGS